MAMGDPPMAGAPFLEEVWRMLAARQWRSASLLAGIAAARLGAQLRATPTAAAHGLYVDALVAAGDAVAGQGEWRRALAHYSSALTWVKSPPRGAAGQQPPPPPSAATSTPPRVSEGALRLRIAEAYLKLGDAVKALEHLEKIEGGALDGASALMAAMAKAGCYRRRGSREAAAEAYRAALTLDPFCVEAVAGLLEVAPAQADASAAALKRLYGGPHEWLHTWVDLLKCKVQGDYVAALRAAEALLQGLGDYSTAVVLEAAECQYRLNNCLEATFAFERVRHEDFFATDRMDVYALVLRQSAAGLKDLNQLAHALLVTNPQAPEAWVALAVLSDRKGRPETAHGFLNKATELDPQHLQAHLLRGHLLAADRKPGPAVKAYRKAYHLSRDLSVYQGLVAAHLLNAQPLDASLMANEAVDLYPGQPLALVLAGNVYCHAKQLVKARKAYDKALALRPESVEAVLSAVDLDCLEGRWPDAVARLLPLVPHQRALHTRLAELYVRQKAFGDAVFHYHAALHHNPTNAAALAGLKRAERWLGGGPDPNDGDGDGEGEDEDEDLASDG